MGFGFSAKFSSFLLLISSSCFLMKKKKKVTAPSEETRDELTAISSIFASDEFRLHEDQMGFVLLVIPSDSDKQHAWCSVELLFR